MEPEFYMSLHQITCPNCNHSFPLETAISNDFEATLLKQAEAKLHDSFAEKEQNYANELAKLEQERKTKEQDLEKILLMIRNEHKEQMEAERKSQTDMIAKMNNDNFTRIAEERQKFEKENIDKIDSERKRNDELILKIEAEREAKYELQKQYELKEKESVQKLDEEINKIANKLNADFNAKNEWAMQEKDNLIAEERLQRVRLQKQIEELQKKSSQKSMELQGEAMELNLESRLKEHFIYDNFQEVSKGIRGADLIQQVYRAQGVSAGAIVYEFKNAQNFSYDWITKLKDDSNKSGGSVQLLVTTVFPKEAQDERITKIEGVWVCRPEYTIIVATIIREQILKVNEVMASQSGKDSKMQALYDYLTTDEFKNKFTRILETFDEMKDTLDSEKKAMTKHWQNRQIQIEKVLINSTEIYTKINAIALENYSSGLSELNALAEKETKKLPDNIDLNNSSDGLF